MTNYEIIEDVNPVELERKVNEMIKEGYKPLGGVSVAVWYEGSDSGYYTSSQTRYLYCQAMVRTGVMVGKWK